MKGTRYLRGIFTLLLVQASLLPATSQVTFFDEKLLRISGDQLVMEGGKTFVWQQSDSGDVAVFFMVRHAEKDLSIPDDPPLTPVGVSRSARLAELLRGQPILKVFSTKYRRTMETAAPLMAARGIGLELYQAGGQDRFIGGVLQQASGSQYLWVGHSNTVPRLLNYLTGTAQFADLPDAEYDNLYIVRVRAVGSATVVRVRY